MKMKIGFSSVTCKAVLKEYIKLRMLQDTAKLQAIAELEAALHEIKWEK